MTFRMELKNGISHNKTRLEPTKWKEQKGDMEELLNSRLDELKRVYENAVANKNYWFAEIVSNHIDEVNALIYLLKNQIINDHKEA